MTPEQAIRLLSVKDWPPQTEHWPPPKNTWRPGMHLVGRIERMFTMPRGKGSHHEGEFYPAMWIRRWPDGALVTFHGYHTAALEDLPAMQPGPGLLFAGLWRGTKDNGFEEFKYIVAPWDDPPPQPAQPSRGANGSQQVRQADGQPTEASSAHAPEGTTSGGVVSPSGSNSPASPAQPASLEEARAYVQAQSPEWQGQFREQLGLARVAGDIGGTPSLQQIQALIARTHERMAALAVSANG
jgi:hypothetical protein